MNKFDVTDGTNAPRMTPKHHQSQNTRSVVLPVNAREDGSSVVALSFLPWWSPNKHDFGYCHNKRSMLPRFKRTRWKAVAELHEILQALGDPCHVNLASISCLATRWLQLVARWPTTDCHGRSANVWQQTTLADFQHFSMVSTKTVSRTKSCSSILEHRSTCSANSICAAEHACALASQIDSFRRSVKKWTTQISASGYAWSFTCWTSTQHQMDCRVHPVVLQCYVFNAPCSQHGEISARAPRSRWSDW